MAFLTSLLFKLAYYYITLGYPAYQVYLNSKANKMEKLWLVYFFIFGIITLLESTVLLPFKYLLGLIFGSCCCACCVMKLLFSLWLWLPSYRGALLLEEKLWSYIEHAHELILPVCGKFLKILGIPDRNSEETK